MKLVSTIIDEVKADFEGGNSLACDWNIIVKRAVQTALENINPAPIKRRVPIYGGLVADTYLYYCPTDVRVPIALITNDEQMTFTYVPAKVFYEQRKANTFTIETFNGYSFIVAFQLLTNAYTVIDALDSIGTAPNNVTGTSTPVLNDADYLSGSGAIQGAFTDTGKTIGRTLATALNLSSYTYGTIILPMKFVTAKNISSVSLKLKTDATNYYTVSSSVDSIGSTFVDGWNRVRFLVKNLTATLSPSLANITAWEVTITTTTGNTETVILDNITIQKSAPYNLKYYSSNVFVDGVSGAWKSTVDYTNNDLLNFTEDECAIVHYEMCMILATTQTQQGNFGAQLKRKYTNYFADNPSDAMPFTYNINEEIDMSVDGSISNIDTKI